MSNDFIDFVGGIIFLIMGLSFAIFYKRIARYTVEFNKKFWGLHSSSDQKWNEIAFLLGGICFIIFGLLSIFKII